MWCLLSYIPHSRLDYSSLYVKFYPHLPHTVTYSGVWLRMGSMWKYNWTVIPQQRIGFKPKPWWQQRAQTSALSENFEPNKSPVFPAGSSLCHLWENIQGKSRISAVGIAGYNGGIEAPISSGNGQCGWTLAFVFSQMITHLVSCGMEWKDIRPALSDLNYCRCSIPQIMTTLEQAQSPHKYQHHMGRKWRVADVWNTSLVGFCTGRNRHYWWFPRFIKTVFCGR